MVVLRETEFDYQEESYQASGFRCKEPKLQFLEKEKSELLK